MPSSKPDFVSTIVIGYRRDNGVEFMPPLFEGTPYVMTSFLDLVESREPYRYTPHNLGVVLESLHPRPRAFVVGPAIDPSLARPILASMPIKVIISASLKNYSVELTRKE